MTRWAAALAALGGFDNSISADRDARQLTRDLEGFVEDAEGADVAVLYYSGHGIEAGADLAFGEARLRVPAPWWCFPHRTSPLILVKALGLQRDRDRRLLMSRRGARRCGGALILRGIGARLLCEPPLKGRWGRRA